MAVLVGRDARCVGASGMCSVWTMEMVSVADVFGVSDIGGGMA